MLRSKTEDHVCGYTSRYRPSLLYCRSSKRGLCGYILKQVRWINIPLEERLCRMFIDQFIVEAEFHFLCVCGLSQNERILLHDCVSKLHP